MLELSFTDGFSLMGFTPAPDVEGENLPQPVFNADGQAEVGGIVLKRKIEQLSPTTIGIDITLTNQSKIPIKINTLSLFKITIPPFTTAEFKDYLVYRLARQKNDIPGPFRPGVQDRNMRDAVFSSAEVVAGGGISWNNFDAPDAVLPTTFHSDPGMVVTADGHNALFIGFDGQTEHLSDVVFRTTADHSQFDSIEAIAEFDGIMLQPGESRQTHRLIIEVADCARMLFKYHVDRIIENYGSRVPEERSVYCSWYYYGEHIDADEIRANLASLHDEPIAIDIFQIDMGWEDFFGDWQTNQEKFPDGMQVIADEILAAGYLPGIWTAPFVIAPDSIAAQKYSDIIMRDSSGNPCLFNCTKGACYTLDPFAPRAGIFLKEFYERLSAWGYKYHKLDFMRAVFIHDDVCFQQPNRTRAEAYRRGMELIREALGNAAIINACGGLIEGSAGLADVVRLGADLRGHWAADGSSITAYSTRIKQNISRNFYQGLFMVDPDALQLRRNEAAWRGDQTYAHLSMGKFSDEEAFSIVVNQFLAGGVVCFSERLKFIDADRRALFHKVIPAYSAPATHFGAWNDYLPELFSTHFGATTDLPAWNIISLCNWNGDQPKSISFKAENVPELPPAESYAVFELKEQQFLGIFTKSDIIELFLPIHGCRVVRLTPLTGYGKYLIGTDSNLSAGMELASFDGNNAILESNIYGDSGQLTILNYQRDGIDTIKLNCPCIK